MMPAQLLLGAEVQSLSWDLQFHLLHAFGLQWPNLCHATSSSQVGLFIQVAWV